MLFPDCCTTLGPKVRQRSTSAVGSHTFQSGLFVPRLCCQRRCCGVLGSGTTVFMNVGGTAAADHRAASLLVVHRPSRFSSNTCSSSRSSTSQAATASWHPSKRPAPVPASVVFTKVGTFTRPRLQLVASLPAGRISDCIQYYDVWLVLVLALFHLNEETTMALRVSFSKPKDEVPTKGHAMKPTRSHRLR